MYKITVQTLTGNEHTIYVPGNEEYVVTNAVLSLSVGSAGEFNFTMPLGNPLYNEIVHNSIITVYEDNAEIWRGDIQDIKVNFDKSLNVYCLEDMAWLGEESVAMTAITNQTYLQRFTNAIAGYNSNQVAKRQFTLGVLTSVTTTNLCTWKPQYEETLLDCLRNYIADDGYVRIRRAYSGGTLTRYVDIVKLSDFGSQADQKIEFGSNLLDFVKEIDNTNFLNVLYPYGKETETPLYGDIMQRIAGTPIQNDASIAAFGRRARTVIFETDSLARLNSLALAYLNRYSQPSMKIEVKAIDLGNIESVNRMHLGDSVRVVANTFGVDQWDYITQQDLDLLNLANNQITLADSVRVRSLTSQVAEQAAEIEDMRTPYSILEEAKANALNLLEGTDGGIITFVVNSDSQITEQRILNNIDYDQATKAWRWSLGGLAYMHRDYPTDDWTVGVAINMNGEIVADYITTGSLNADRIAGGTLTIGGSNYSNKSVIEVLDTSNNSVVTLNKDGITLSKGTIQSNDYEYTSGRYSASGTKIDLANGTITSEKFAIAANGTVYLANGAVIGGYAKNTDLDDYATIDGLEDGTTTINGGCITTGSINANLITTGTLKSANYNNDGYSYYPFANSGMQIDMATGEIRSSTLGLLSDGYSTGDYYLGVRGIKVGAGGDLLTEDNFIWVLESQLRYDPAMKIAYDSIVAINNGVYYYAQFSSSDRRFKENINPLDTKLSVEFIDKTEPKEFKYKNNEGTHYGMIAQEVRELLDELGEEDSQLEHTHKEKEDEYHDIRYYEYIPHLINYVKDLRAEIDSLKDTINTLKEERA